MNDPRTDPLCSQVKGLSIEHEKLAVAQRHAAESGSAAGEAQANGAAASSGHGSTSSASNGPGSNGNAAEGPETPESGLALGVKRRAPTPAPPSPAPTYSLPNVYSAVHYYDSPQKKLMR